MENNASSSPSQPATVNPGPSSFLPAGVREEYERFATTGNRAALDAVVFAILEDFIPRRPDRPLAEMPGDTLLMDDLGFDSLALTEVIFCTEDLFRIRIANEEIQQVRSLDDLREFVGRKVGLQSSR